MHQLLIKAFTHPPPDLSPLTCKHFQLDKCFAGFSQMSKSNISTNYRLSEIFLNFPEVWSGNFLMYTRWEPSERNWRKVWQSASWRHNQTRQTGNEEHFLSSTDWGEEAGNERLIDWQSRSWREGMYGLVMLQTNVSPTPSLVPNSIYQFQPLLLNLGALNVICHVKLCSCDNVWKW